MSGRGPIYVAALVLACVSIWAAPALARQVFHRADEQAFVSYVETYVGGWRSSRDPGGWRRDQAWVAENPEAVLAEGKRACRWLASRQEAPSVDPTGKSSSGKVTSRYVNEVPASTELGVSPVGQGRKTIVAGAWSYLCWWEHRDKTSPTSTDPD